MDEEKARMPTLNYQTINAMGERDRDVLQTYFLYRIVKFMDSLKLPQWLRKG